METAPMATTKPWCPSRRTGGASGGGFLHSSLLLVPSLPPQNDSLGLGRAGVGRGVGAAAGDIAIKVPRPLPLEGFEGPPGPP